MSAGFPNPKFSLLCAMVMLGLVSSLEAQQSGMGAGKPIVFSAPDASTSAGSTATESESPLRKIKDPIQVPSHGFGVGDLDSPMPLPPTRPPVKRERDSSKDWIFMTPAEILGVTTPEKMMGISERDATGNRKDLTPEERYMARLNQAQSGSTNSSSSGDSETPLNSYNGRNTPGASSPWDNSKPSDGKLGSSSGMLGSLLNNAVKNSMPNNDFGAGQNGNSDWDRLTGSPKPMTDFSPAQKSSMDQFREMLNANPASTPIGASPSPGFNAQSAPAFNLSPNAPNSFGGSAAPLTSGFGQQSTMPKMPTLFSQPVAQPAIPSWKIAATTPDPFDQPKRKF
jgi:hypothetical protein